MTLTTIRLRLLQPRERRSCSSGGAGADRSRIVSFGKGQRVGDYFKSMVRNSSANQLDEWLAKEEDGLLSALAVARDRIKLPFPQPGGNRGRRPDRAPINSVKLLKGQI